MLQEAIELTNLLLKVLIGVITLATKLTRRNENSEDEKE